jgi:hypothetical protein
MNCQKVLDKSSHLVMKCALFCSGIIILGVYHALMTRIRRMVADQIEEAVTFLRIERDH